MCVCLSGPISNSLMLGPVHRILLLFVPNHQIPRPIRPPIGYTKERFEHIPFRTILPSHASICIRANYIKAVYVGRIFYSVTMLFVKASILTEWIHLFVPRGTRDAFFWTCQAVLVCNTIYYVVIVVTTNMACSPRAKIWDDAIPGTCRDKKAPLVISSGINILSDLAILALPQRIIWRLHLSKEKRIGVSLVFTFGILCASNQLHPEVTVQWTGTLIHAIYYRTVISACVRMAESFKYVNATDTTYAMAPVWLWALGEMTCTFIVACVPALPKLFKYHGWTAKLERPLRWLKGRSRTSSDTSTPTWPRSSYYRSGLRKSMHFKIAGNILPLVHHPDNRDPGPLPPEQDTIRSANGQTTVIPMTHIPTREECANDTGALDRLYPHYPWAGRNQGQN